MDYVDTNVSEVHTATCFSNVLKKKTVSISKAEDGGNGYNFLRNVGINIQFHMTSRTTQKNNADNFTVVKKLKC